MASPQELMLRGPKAPTPQATPGPAATVTQAPVTGDAAPQDASAAVPGEHERAVRDFLEETDGALRELRQAMDELRARVDAMDARRRARRERIDQAARDASARLDALRLER